jgi:hypothetical protein
VGAERDAEGLRGTGLPGDAVEVVGQLVVPDVLGQRCSTVTAGLVEDLGARYAGQQRTGLGDRGAEAVRGDRDGGAAARDYQLLVPDSAGFTSTR